MYFCLEFATFWNLKILDKTDFSNEFIFNSSNLATTYCRSHIAKNHSFACLIQKQFRIFYKILDIMQYLFLQMCSQLYIVSFKFEIGRKVQLKLSIWLAKFMWTSIKIIKLIALQNNAMDEVLVKWTSL